ncbi:72 kDa type IV collagenase-like isoform X1 [Oculina patagonica]
MIYAHFFVLICLCITQQVCWARSEHLKEWVIRSGKARKENLIDSTAPLDQFDSNGCVKTVDGQSPDQCCYFPFVYKGIQRTSCVKGITTDRTWCGVTYNYDQEKQWGWCPECSVKTVDGQSPNQCCEFPFLYKGTERTSCVKGITTDRKWCGVTYDYDQEKQWGWCPDTLSPTPTEPLPSTSTDWRGWK